MMPAEAIPEQDIEILLLSQNVFNPVATGKNGALPQANDGQTIIIEAPPGVQGPEMTIGEDIYPPVGHDRCKRDMPPRRQGKLPEYIHGFVHGIIISPIFTAVNSPVKNYLESREYIGYYTKKFKVSITFWRQYG
jgi:hypothetical protein